MRKGRIPLQKDHHREGTYWKTPGRTPPPEQQSERGSGRCAQGGALLQNPQRRCALPWVAFLVAYLCCLVFVAAPAYLMEMVMGHYTKKNTLGCFRQIHPRWQGLAWMQTIMLVVCICYYNVVIAHTVVYAAGSLFDPMPWSKDSSAYWNEGVLNNYGGDYTFFWVCIFLSLGFGKELLHKITAVTVVEPISLLFVLLVRAVNLPGAYDGIAFYIL